METGSQPITEMPFTTRENVQERLIWLRDTLHIKWHIIASGDEFGGIPIGTLHKMYKTGKVPKKWWRVLKVRATPFTLRVSIHKFNMNKAVQTIMDNISAHKREELLAKLWEAHYGKTKVPGG